LSKYGLTKTVYPYMARRKYKQKYLYLQSDVPVHVFTDNNNASQIRDFASFSPNILFTTHFRGSALSEREKLVIINVYITTTSDAKILN